LRWWLIVRAEAGNVPFVPLIAARLSAFGISYFTLGPQVGGEPFQILYLRRQQGTSAVRATATVVLDKLLELLANFVFLSLGLAALIWGGILEGAPGLTVVIVAALLALALWPAIHLVLLWSARHPVSAALRLLPFVPTDGRLARYVRAAERLAGQSCRRHPRTLLSAIAVSFAPCALAVIEYAFITSFLGAGLNPWQTVAAWSAGWLSFLVPLPGGLGALEASQVLALGRFGVTAATAIGVTLLMRARDLLFGGLGLLFAAETVGRRQSKEHHSGVLIGMSNRPEGSAALPEPLATSKESHD
jgi:hypothetical protein